MEPGQQKSSQGGARLRWVIGGGLSLVLLGWCVMATASLWAQGDRLERLEGSRRAQLEASGADPHVRAATRRARRAESRAAELERRVEELEVEVGKLKSHRAALVLGDGEMTPQQVVSAREAVLSVLESGEEGVRERLRGALKKERKLMREERREKRRERWRRRGERRLKELAVEANLSPEQVEELQPMMDSERKEFREVFREARRDLDFMGGFNKIMKLRAETDERARLELDEDQAMVYDAWRRKEVDDIFGMIKGVVQFAVQGKPRKAIQEK